MNELHFELPSGAAGDMILGALIDCGADYDQIVSSLKKLDIADWDIDLKSVVRSGITAKKIIITDKTVSSAHDHSHDHSHSHSHKAHRHLSDMLKVLDNPALSNYVKEKAAAIFNLLAEAEGKVHGHPKEKVHFHEISGIDTLIDVIGSALAVENLQVDHITSSEVSVGSGTIKCAHGLMPVPAPATMEIIQAKSIPINSGVVDTELLTPTGAAILGIFCDEFGKTNGGKVASIGYGAGDKDFKATANTVRAIIYNYGNDSQKTLSDSIIEIRFSTDDTTGEELGLLQERLYTSGALESYALPAVMKKSRCGFEIVVLLKTTDQTKIEEIIFASGVTLGLRVREVTRSILERKFEKVVVLGHVINVKLGLYKGKFVSVKAEYEDCKNVSEITGKEFAEIKKMAESSF